MYEKNLSLIKGENYVLKDKWEPGDKRREGWISEHLSIGFWALWVTSALLCYDHLKGTVGFFFQRHCILTEKEFQSLSVFQFKIIFI